MTMADWKQIVGAVAPGLATALGGPLAGVAVGALAKALTGDPATPEDQVAQAVITGGSDALLKIKQADNEFAEHMRQLDIDLERINAGDRASARDREVKAADSWTPRGLAILVTVGFFAVLGYMLVLGKPAAGGDALLVMLGALGGAWASIISYYFGSSAGSDAKTKLLTAK
jgi:hypothetical protein